MFQLARRRPTTHPIRRLVAIPIVVTVCALELGACGVNETASGSFKTRHPNTLTVATSSVPLPGFWEGTASHPTGGFEYELAVALAKHFSLDHVKIVVVPFHRIVAGHLDGADLAISDLTATKAREKVLDFTGPYLPAKPGVLVRKGQGVPDLKTAQGLTWAVQKATTLRDFLDDTVQPSSQPKITSSQNETAAAVEHHIVDAGLLDLPVAAAIARASGGKLSVAGQFDSDDSVSAAVPQGSDNLDALDSAIRGLTADGTISSLAEHWLDLSIDGTSADDVPLIRSEG
jgi:polar amino acid transport system substrate-binding protein